MHNSPLDDNLTRLAKGFIRLAITDFCLEGMLGCQETERPLQHDKIVGRGCTVLSMWLAMTPGQLRLKAERTIDPSELGARSR